MCPGVRTRMSACCDGLRPISWEEAVVLFGVADSMDCPQKCVGDFLAFCPGTVRDSFMGMAVPFKDFSLCWTFRKGCRGVV